MLLRLLPSIALALLLFSATQARAEDRQSNFVADLSAAGYSVNVEPQTVPHPGLSVKGSIVSASKGEALAKVELLDYPSQDALERDWIVADQQAPKPKTATSDFAGQVLVWRENSLLVLDYNSPNDAGTVQTVAFIFLGRKGVSFEGVPVRIIPPGTGDAGLAKPLRAHANLCDEHKRLQNLLGRSPPGLSPTTLTRSGARGRESKHGRVFE